MPSHTSAKTAETASRVIEATVTSKGQVTLPKALRTQLGIDAGSRIRFTVGAGGKAQVERVGNTLDDLWKLADSFPKSDNKVMTFEEMDEAKMRRIW